MNRNAARTGSNPFSFLPSPPFLAFDEQNSIRHSYFDVFVAHAGQLGGDFIGFLFFNDIDRGHFLPTGISPPGRFRFVKAFRRDTPQTVAEIVEHAIDLPPHLFDAAERREHSSAGVILDRRSADVFSHSWLHCWVARLA
jgi:hypothetical protein